MTFDPEQFANTTMTESNSTEFVPLPEGEYNGVIKDDGGIAFRTIDTKVGPRTIMDVNIKLDLPPSVQEEIGRKDSTIRHQIWLDFTDQGGLDMGKGRNVALGRLREAVGLNVPGQPFQFNQLKGRPLHVRTKNRKVDDAIFTDVADVTKLA